MISSGLRSPHSIGSLLNHLVLLMNFISETSFIRATSETKSRKPRPMAAILFLSLSIHTTAGSAVPELTRILSGQGLLFRRSNPVWIGEF